ncbi:MAG: PAS domain S-box protein [Candidatus Omnitrophota bacterium]
MPIRQKLIALFLAIAIIPIIFISFLAFSNTKAALLSDAYSKLEAVVDLKRNDIEHYFEGLRGDAQMAQNDLNVRKNLPLVTLYSQDMTNPEYIKAKEMLDGQWKVWLKIKKEASDFMLLSPEGKIVYAANEAHGRLPLGHPLPGPGGEAFEEGKKGVYVSEIYKNPDPGLGYQYGLLVTAPVHDFEKKFVGVVAFEINMEPIYGLIQGTTGLGKTGEMLLVGKEGDHVLFLNPLRHDPAAALTRKVRFGENSAILVQRALESESGSDIEKDYRGQEVMAAWRHLPDLDWGLVAKIDMQEVLEPVITLRNLAIVICVIVLFSAGLIAITIADAISKPIRALHKGTEIVGNGNLDHKVGTDVQDEIGQLSRAFDQMTGKLKVQMEETKAANQQLRASNQQLRATEQQLRASNQQLRASEQQLRAANQQLKKSEEQVRLLVESVKDYAIFMLDPQGNVMSWNSGAEKIKGYRPGEIIGKHFSCFYTKEDVESGKPKHELEATLAQGRFEDEGWRVRKDGSRFWADAIISTVYNSEGEILGFSQVTRDLTERKRMEEALKASEEMSRNIIESAQDAIVIMDNNGNISSWNRAAKATFGYTEKEVLGKELHGLLAPKRYYDAYRKAFSHFQKTGEGTAVGKTLELAAVRKDGTEFPIELSMSAFHLNGMWHAAGIVRDVTEHKKMSEQLMAAAEEWRTTFDSISDMISIVDQNYKIIKVNKSFADKLKVSPQDLIGKTCYEIIHSTNEPLPLCPHRGALEKKTPQHSEYFEPHLDIYLEVTTSPIFDEKGEVIASVRIARDISQRKKMEKTSGSRSWENLSRIWPTKSTIPL